MNYEKDCEPCVHNEKLADEMPCIACTRRYNDSPSNWEAGANYRPMTNYERIKAMSVEEMAEMLRGFCLNSACCDDCPLDGICPSVCCEFKHTWKNWLESEVDT